jgi:hypothetical protein
MMLSRRFHKVSTEGMPEPKVPTLNLPGHITTSGRHLFKAARALAEVSDHYAVMAETDGAALIAEDSYGLAQAVGLSVSPKLDQGGNARSLFPADYFRMIAGALKDCVKVTIHVGNDLPMKIDAELEGVSVMFLLAPRIESD